MDLNHMVSTSEENAILAFMRLVDETNSEAYAKLFKKCRKNAFKLGLLTIISGVAFLWHERRVQEAEARIDRLTRDVEELLEERVKTKLEENTESGN